jgi:TM2 domain-containing membrane protein YozV
MAEAVFQPAAILDPKVFGLPVDREVLFSNHKNLYKKRIEKRQRKLFVKIGPVKPFLRRNEKILLVTTGYSPLSSLAQVLTGFVFSYLKRSLFVFTNQRIIHLPATSSYKYRDTLAQIAYSGCKSIALKGGTLVVEYSRRGRIEKFKAIAVPERKKIRALLKKSIPLSGTKGHLAARIHLCPRCARALAAKKYQCSHCQLGFKSRIVAAFLAIVVPGGGYLYVRQYLLGALNALLEVFLLAFSIVLLIDYYDRIPVNKIYLVGIPAIYLYVKITAIIHSNHFIDEYIPTKKSITPGKKN